MAAARRGRWSGAILAPVFVAAQVLCFCAFTQASTGVAAVHAGPRPSKAGHDCCPEGKKRDDSRTEHGGCGHCNAAQLFTADRWSAPNPIAAAFSFVVPAHSFAEIELPVFHALSVNEHGGSPPGASMLTLKCVLLI